MSKCSFGARTGQILAIPKLCLDELRIGLIGDNCSGKITMLRLMIGLLSPTRGCVEVAGLDTVRHRKNLPAKVGLLFQNPDHRLVFPTVAEEVAFGPAQRGIPAPQARQQAMAFLERHGCAQWADRNVNELSGGQKQPVCIVAVLAAAIDPSWWVSRSPGSICRRDCFCPVSS